MDVSWVFVAAHIAIAENSKTEKENWTKPVKNGILSDIITMTSNEMFIDKNS